MRNRRWYFLLAMLLILCFLCSLLPAVVAAEKDYGLSREELDVLKDTNLERGKEGLAPLTSLPELQRGAGIRAEELVTVTDHVRPDGTKWYTILDTLQLPPYIWGGENVAAGQHSAQGVVTAWMNSPGHRENILRDSYAHLGTGYYYAEDSFYKTYWVQIFYTSIDCEYISMSLEFFGEKNHYVGTEPENLDLVACLQCKSCGSSYLPVLPEYCSGYDPTVAERQTITVSVLGQSATMEIDLLVDGEEPTETPTEPSEEPTEPTEEPTEPTEPAKPVEFNDLEKGSWYEDSVNFMVRQGLMNGVGKNRFDPYGKVTRAMLVTILYRVEGSPSTDGLPNPFRDVPNSWYTDAVIWAASEGIVTGVKVDRFNPEGNITREQIATILYRYEGSPQVSDALPPFADSSRISGYALCPLNWAIAEGLINGVGGGRLAPGDTATRAQIATILARYIQR